MKYFLYVFHLRKTFDVKLKKNSFIVGAVINALISISDGSGPYGVDAACGEENGGKSV